MCSRERKHHHEDTAPHGRGHGPHSHGERGGRGGYFGGGGRGEHSGGRARRGEVRYVLLGALADGPKHGYEIIKALEERSDGRYAPSPGAVYPTLQYLEELGLVRADQGAERRVYSITEAGQADLAAHSEEIDAFWARFKGPQLSPASQAELGFLTDELGHLAQTVRGGLRPVLERDDHETVRKVRQAVENFRNEVRRLIAAPDGGSES